MSSLKARRSPPPLPVLSHVGMAPSHVHCRGFPTWAKFRSCSVLVLPPTPKETGEIQQCIQRSLNITRAWGENITSVFPALSPPNYFTLCRDNFEHQPECCARGHPSRYKAWQIWNRPSGGSSRLWQGSWQPKTVGGKKKKKSLTF